MQGGLHGPAHVGSHGDATVTLNLAITIIHVAHHAGQVVEVGQEEEYDLAALVLELGLQVAAVGVRPVGGIDPQVRQQGPAGWVE